MSDARARTLALAALVAAVAATFSEALFSGRVFFQRDILSYWYPGMEAFRRAIAEGALPLWNPHAGFGTPLLADASFQLAYPPTWLALRLPLAAQYELFVVGHCLFATLGALVLARRAGLGWAAAGFGPDPLPRAYVVAGERSLAGSADDWASILAPGFDPRREVWLADGGRAAVGELTRTAPPGAPRLRTAKVSERRADVVEVETESDAPGVLVLVEAYDPGWRALVDGRPSPVRRANVLFRGVALPAGRHLVRFEYRPRSALLGLRISLGGVLALAGLAAGALAARHRRLNPGRAEASIASAQEGTA